MVTTLFTMTAISESQSQKATSANANDAVLQTGIKGRLSKSVAGSSNVTLTEIEAGNAILEFTGALTGNINVIVPTSSKLYFIYNNTSGSFTLTVKTSGGTGIAVTQGARALLLCDGTNVVNALPKVASAYTVTNVTTDRTYDANSTTLDEIADVLGTLIADLQGRGYLS